MTINDIKELAQALQQKNNKKEIKKQINRVFRNKSCSTIICEIKKMMPELSNNDGNIALLIVVLSLLHKNSGLMNAIQKALVAENMIQRLYGGLLIYLRGKNPKLCLKIEWSDSHFPNRYEFLRRFTGEFGYWEHREVLYAAEIIALTDKNKFEQLALQDTTRLILLNMLSLRLDYAPSDTLIMRLITDNDELLANIGFYFATRSITNDVRDYEQLRRNPDSPCTKTQQQIDKNIVEHLEHFHVFYSNCSADRKASLLINYILSEIEYPLQFGYWLMEAALQEALIYQITSSGKIRTLNSLQTVSSLVHDFPSLDASGVHKKADKLYVAIVDVLKTFITEKSGIYTWDIHQENLFQNICSVLPAKSKQGLNTFLRKAEKNYMVSKLDEMVRFSIYLEDKRQWDICQGMLRVLDSSITEKYAL